MSQEKESYSEAQQGILMSQAFEQIRKQDDLIQTWTKYLLSIQAGLAIALAFLLKMEGEPSDLVKIGLLFIPLLGIFSAIILVNIIVREYQVRGRYVRSLRDLKFFPAIFGIFDRYPEPDRRGYMSRQFKYLRGVLIGGWIIVGVAFIIGFYKPISLLP